MPPSPFRKAIAMVLPLFAVSGALFGMDFLDNGRIEWAFWPILAMSIPVVITLGRGLLGLEPDRRKARSASPPDATAQPARAIAPAMMSDLDRVRSYKRDIEAMAARAGNDVQRENLRELARQMNAWCGDAERLAQRISDYKTNATVQSDLQAVPQAIRKLLAQIEAEKDARVKESLERTLATRSAQWESLQKLQTTMRHAETQFESTCAALGTLYNQALAGQGTHTISDYAHLSKEVSEEAQALRDQLSALEDIKLGRVERLSGQ